MDNLMKFFIGFSIFTFAFLGVNSQLGAMSACEDALEGEHVLRKMTNSVYSSGSVTGSGFFFMGSGGMSINGKQSTEPSVTFAWLHKSGDWIITTLPLSKVRVRFSDVSAPYVKFRWIWCHSETQINDSIVYVLIFCKESDWPTDVTLPMNKN